jgi:hypothetical protein
MLYKLIDNLKKIPFVKTINYIFYSTLIAFMILIAYFFYYLSEITNLNLFVSETNLLKANLYKLVAYENKNLFDEYNNEIDATYGTFRKIDENINNLKFMYRLYDLSNGDLLKLYEVVSSYKNHFDNFLQHRSELVEKLLYNLKISRERFIAILSNHNIKSFTEHSLLLEIDSSQFLQFRSTAYAEQFLKDYEAIHKNISVLQIKDDEKNNLILYLSEYKNSFISIVETMTKIGLSRNSGINGAMREDISIAILNSNNIIIKIEKLKYQREGLLNLYLILIAVSLILAILSALFLFSKKLSKDIFLFEKTASEIYNSGKNLNFNNKFYSDGLYKLSTILNGILLIIYNNTNSQSKLVYEHEKLIEKIVSQNEQLKIEEKNINESEVSEQTENISNLEKSYQEIVELNRKSLALLYSAIDTHLIPMKKNCQIFEQKH